MDGLEEWTAGGELELGKSTSLGHARQTAVQEGIARQERQSVQTQARQQGDDAARQGKARQV